MLQCPTVDFTSVDTRNSEREAATFSRMQAIASAYQSSEIYQNMLEETEQSLQRADKPTIPFKNKESPNSAAKLQVLFRYSCCLNSPGNVPPNFNSLCILEAFWNVFTHVDSYIVMVGCLLSAAFTLTLNSPFTPAKTCVERPSSDKIIQT